MDNGLQSKTFKFYHFEEVQFEVFKNDILSLKDFQLPKFEPIVKCIINIILASTESEERELSNKMIKEGLVRNIEEADSFHRITNFFLKVFLNEKTIDDSPEIIIKDLSNKLIINEDKLHSIRKLLEIIKLETPRYEKEKRIESLKKGVLPYIKGFNTTVELRGIFNKEFKIGDNLDIYVKELDIEKNTIPIISVSISLDSGTPDTFYFQASPKHLKLLIEEFESALHKSKMLEERFNPK